jgi:hypothetical protein
MFLVAQSIFYSQNEIVDLNVRKISHKSFYFKKVYSQNLTTLKVLILFKNQSINKNKMLPKLEIL